MAPPATAPTTAPTGKTKNSRPPSTAPMTAPVSVPVDASLWKVTLPSASLRTTAVSSSPSLPACSTDRIDLIAASASSAPVKVTARNCPIAGSPLVVPRRLPRGPSKLQDTPTAKRRPTKSGPTYRIDPIGPDDVEPRLAKLVDTLAPLLDPDDAASVRALL